MTTACAELLERNDMPGKVASLLGLNFKTAKAKSAMSQVDTLIREGFSIKVADRLKSALNLTDGQLSDTLGLSPRTLQRKRKQHEQFSRLESDMLFRIARIFALAIEVLEDEKRAAEWMRKPQFGLGGKIPFEMIQTETGAHEVENLLGRIEYSVYS